MLFSLYYLPRTSPACNDCKIALPALSLLLEEELKLNPFYGHCIGCPLSKELCLKYCCMFVKPLTTWVPRTLLNSLVLMFHHVPYDLPWTHTVWWCQGPTSSSVIDVSLLLIDVSLLSSDEVLEIIKGPSIKSCSLDPLPASVFTKVIDDLLPTITQITNRSFNLASSPLTWKRLSSPLS